MYPTVAEGHEYVAFDLDGTLAEDTWPNPRIGQPIPEGLAMLRFYADQGYAIVLYTARPESHRARIERWLRMNSLDTIVYDVFCGKPIAGLYVDDRATRFSRQAVVNQFKRKVEVHVHSDDCTITKDGYCTCS